MASAWYLNPQVVVNLVAVLLLWKFSGFYAEKDDLSKNEVGNELFKRKIIYDVSEVIRSSDNLGQAEILPEDLYVREVNTSANYYFVANDAAEDDICWEDSECKWSGIKGFSLIFSEKANKTDMLAMADVRISNTTFLNLLQMDNSSIDSVIMYVWDGYCIALESIHWYFSKPLNISTGKHSVKTGMEYTDEFLELCHQVGVPVFENLDHTILRIHVSPLNTMLSYGTFYRKIQKILEKNRDFAQRLCSHCTQYIRLYNDDWRNTIRADYYEKYNRLMTNFLGVLSQQNSGNEVFIFSPNLQSVNLLPNDVYLRQTVSQYYNRLIGQQFENVSSQDRHLLACAHQRMVKLWLSYTQNILAHDPNLEVLSSLLTTTCKTSTKSGKNYFNLPSNTSLSLALNGRAESKIDEQIEKILEIRRKNPIGNKIAKVYFYGGLNKNEIFTKVEKLLQSQNIDVGCIGGNYQAAATTNLSAAISRTIKECSAVMNLSKDIIQIVNVQIRKPEDLLTFLIGFKQEKQRFDRLFPGKTLTPSIIFRTPGDVVKPESSYCKPEVQQAKEYYETVYSFANIHGWSILLPRIDYSGTGLWGHVETSRSINQFDLKFEVLFRTNVALTTQEELPMTYPCIQRSLDASRSSINFLENQYSGTTFQTNLREKAPLSKPELQTLLQLATARFPSVEIIATSQEYLLLVEKAVEANAPRYRNRNNNASNSLVFIEVPLADAHSMRQEIYTVLSRNHTAVHVTNWESLSPEQVNLWKNMQDISIPKFGITVQNCSDEINSKVDKLKSLPILPQVSYVVCNTPPVTPDNKNLNWMDEYLGTLFYIKSYMEHFLSIERETGNGVEVMFRLNYFCSRGYEMERFLRFLNDVNQHSAAFKIRYFLVRAFESETYANCSWWRPDTYTDLSSISNFVNREDEHAGREARIHLAREQDQNSNTLYIILFVPIVALLILGMLAQWLYQRKEKSKILTQMEIRQFYRGDEHANPSRANEYCLDFGNMKFPKTYEIPRKDIEAAEIIGSGQFGVVHRGILSKRIEVAVKVPRSDCGKEQFKSTLSELKILCHIGEHLNIVSFLGACTKGIANGNLQIVIEYCKNGCLLQHLRQNQGNVHDDESISLFQMNGFALQIASGMEYIAEKRVVHGDLAARNVLLTSEWTCKIADFGLSRRLYEMNEYVKTSQEPLPWRWMAPESLRNMEFTTKSDVWSYGVTLWEIFSLGMVPYPGLNWTANYVGELENGMRMDKAPHATDDIHAKILECWGLNSEARPTFTELKEYFVGLRNEQYLNLSKV